MGRKNLLADLIDEGAKPQIIPPAALPASSQSMVGRPTLGNRGAVGAMSRSLEQISAERDAAKTLADQLANGQTIVEIDTGLIEDSFVPDRMSGSLSDHESLVYSIREQGQIVPALLRPHPDKSDRFQIAYGHRRVKALKQLGRPVRAIIRNLSDDELVIAQGKENGDRQDLTFIERARFAASLEDKQFKRETIMSALSIDKTELSRMLSISRAIPSSLAEAIGRAPKIGRRRWMEMADLLSSRASIKSTQKLVTERVFLEADSDERFAFIMKAISEPKPPAARADHWVANDGKKIAQIKRSSDRCVVSLDEKLAPDFGDFIISHLPDLYQAFQRERSNNV